MNKVSFFVIGFLLFIAFTASVFSCKFCEYAHKCKEELDAFYMSQNANVAFQMKIILTVFQYAMKMIKAF